MHQPHNRHVPNTKRDNILQADGLGWHGPISVVGAPRRSYGYAFEAPRPAPAARVPLWGRGTRGPVRQHGWRPAPLSDHPSWTVVLMTVMSLASPCWLPAQERSLVQVEQLASTGRAEEARAMLLEWWGTDRSNASRRNLQLGLWLRGRLTVDPGQAARDFRRLVIEYPGGPYADRALFRLAQAAHAQGDRERARTYMASLTRDHPGSPVREQAEAWMARASMAGPPPVLRLVEAEESEDQRTADPPLEESIAELTPTVPAPSRDSTAPALSSGARYAVQLGAFLDESRARALLERATEAGLDVRSVRVEGSRLMHVRVGLFDSSSQASLSFQSVTAIGFIAVIVSDAQNEEPARG